MTTTIRDIYDLIDRLRSEGAQFCVATIVRTAAATSAKAGAKAVVTADGELHGFVGGGCVTGAVRKAGIAAIAAGEPRLIRVRPKEEVVEGIDVDGVELHKSGCPSGGTVELFLEPMRRPPRLVVCGASPVAETLLRLAPACGFEILAAALPEDRARFAELPFHAGFDFADLGITADDAIVVATQGKRDRQALEAALASKASYVGMIGSQTKIAKLLSQLADVQDDRPRRLHAPAGLPIGAIDPQEIALSILAEIVQVRRQIKVPSAETR